MEAAERGLTRRGYLGLGSNVGDRLANLRAAADRLPVVARSSVYAVVAIETTLDPEGLLRLAKSVEAELGRDFGQVRHGPRVVDIDLLLLGDIRLETDRLTLPHRDLQTRRFVLVPLLELDPSLPYRDALDRLEGQRVERVGVL